MMKHFLVVLIPALIAGCAAPGDYPSLAKRPFEKAPANPPSPPPEVAIPSDPALLGRIADALKQAREGVSDFEAALLVAREAAKRGSGMAEGSDPWINAQLAVSRLERTLEPARNALAALDDERRIIDLHPGSPDHAPLEAAIAEVEAIDMRQSASIRELLALLS